MPSVLTTNATITCPHGGLGTTTPLSPKWTVNGGYVATDGDSGTLTCVFTPPCVGYTLKSMGLNATRIDGKNAMLVTDFTQSFTGLPLTIVDMNPAIDASTPSAVRMKISMIVQKIRPRMRARIEPSAAASCRTGRTSRPDNVSANRRVKVSI